MFDFSLYVLMVFTGLMSEKSTIPLPLAHLYSMSKGQAAFLFSSLL